MGLYMARTTKRISLAQIIDCIETAQAYKDLLHTIDDLIDKYKYTLFVQDIKLLEELKRKETEAYLKYIRQPIFEIKGD